VGRNLSCPRGLKEYGKPHAQPCYPVTTDFLLRNPIIPANASSAASIPSEDGSGTGTTSRMNFWFAPVPQVYSVVRGPTPRLAKVALS
jgi:hypothetical protein